MRALYLSALLTTGFVVSSQVYAADCSCDSDTTTSETIVEAETTNGHSLKMRFAVDPVTRAAKKASLCIDPGASVTLAKLWMPDMNHGSTPTRLTEVTPTCTLVERINFLMSGAWEIQVTLAGGDQGTLAVDVED